MITKTRQFTAMVKSNGQSRWLDFQAEKFLQQYLKSYTNIGDIVSVTIKNKKPTRTLAQNNALHLLFELWAEELNAAGYTVQAVLSKKMDLEWDGEKVKELLWRPAQIAILNKKSTTELAKVEDIDRVYDHLNRHLGEKFGITTPFPVDLERQYNELKAISHH